MAIQGPLFADTSLNVGDLFLNNDPQDKQREVEVVHLEPFATRGARAQVRNVHTGRRTWISYSSLLSSSWTCLQRAETQ